MGGYVSVVTPPLKMQDTPAVNENELGISAAKDRRQMRLSFNDRRMPV